MIFLVEYSRGEGRLVSLTQFADSDRLRAERARLELELRLHRESVDHEVVLLEAAAEQALRKTHRRYFERIDQLVETPATGT